MASDRKQGWRSGISASLLLGTCALLTAPAASLALDVVGGASFIDTARSGFASFTPTSVDPRLAEMVAQRRTSGGAAMRFTPAGATDRADRSVTVAVRVDGDAAKAFSARAAIAERLDKPGRPVEITPARFDLGVARGYKEFAQAERPAAIRDLGDSQLPDISAFRPSEGVKNQPSRFTAHIAFEEQVNTGRAPRTAEGLGDQTVDVAGNFRVTRNLDLRAGVRYSQDRDRLAPLADVETDSGSVYVGTQFRF
jgi:hypothetical protein